MNYNTQTITVSVKNCRACGTQLLASYRFCRLCGTSQSHLEFFTKGDSISNHTLKATRPALDSEISALAPARAYRSLSGAVLNSLATTELTAATSRIKSRAAKTAVAAAITIPLWLMIVLLSPLDALQASRKVTNQL